MARGIIRAPLDLRATDNEPAIFGLSCFVSGSSGAVEKHRATSDRDSFDELAAEEGKREAGYRSRANVDRWTTRRVSSRGALFRRERNVLPVNNGREGRTCERKRGLKKKKRKCSERREYTGSGEVRIGILQLFREDRRRRVS